MDPSRAPTQLSPASAAPHPMALGKRLDDMTTLAKSPLMRNLGLRDLGEVVELLDEVVFPRGTVVVREGKAEDEHAYVVLEGRARVRRGGVELAPLEPGDHFGELALIGSRLRPTTVEASTHLRLARLSRQRYVTLSTHHPGAALHLAQGLATVLGEHLARMTDSVGLLLRERSLPRRATVTASVDGIERVVATGTAIGELLPAAAHDARVVAGLVDGRPASIGTPLIADGTLAPIALDAEEGRRVYERSVGLVVLEAAARAGIALRLGPSLSSAQIVYADAPAETIGPPLAAAIEAVRADDLPLREELWTTDEACHHFCERGWIDAAALLRVGNEATVPLVAYGDVYAPSCGPLVQRTGAIDPIRLFPHADGLLVDFGATVQRSLPGGVEAAVEAIAREASSPRFGGQMAREHRAWLASLGVASAGELADWCVAGRVAELVRVAEGFHEKRIGRLADAIAQRRDVRIIAVAGPSSSGKTTFIKRLNVQLEIDGLRPVNVSLDDYYVDREATPRDAHGEYDFEAIEAIDLALLRGHMERLLRGEEVRSARFDFMTGKSLREGGPLLRLGPTDVLVLEGIHALNPSLLGDAAPRASTFNVFIQPATTLPLDRANVVAQTDLRLLRRIVRDRRHRGYTAAQSIARWPSVRRGEILRIFPYQHHADADFDTSLAYEPSVLKVFAERYLLEVTESDAAFATAYRLRKLMDRFVAIHPDSVPPTSILREFIGGSGCEY